MKKENKLKRINISILFCTLLIFFLLISLSLNILKSNELKLTEPLYHYYETENFELYVSPDKTIYRPIIQLFKNAKEDIHCVLRALNFQPIELALRIKEKEGIKVRLFVNSEYKGNKRIYFPFTRFDTENRLGMLHSNYCVIDNQIVFTGSLILNQNTITKNIHTFLIINSSELADRYNSNFWQLYNNQTIKKGAEDKEIITVNNHIRVKPYFCPYDDCEKLVINFINNSKKRINLAVYSFTNPQIFKALLDAKKKGMIIQGVIERKGITKSTIDITKLDGINTDNAKRRVHTKTFIFDDDIIIEGTMNPTYNGANRNDENILVIRGMEVNKIYHTFIETLYNHSLR